MDELKITTMFTRGLIKTIINRVLKKKLGVDIGVDIYDLRATVPPSADGDTVTITVAGEIKISKKDLYNLIMKNI